MKDIFASLRIVNRALIRSTPKGRSNLALYSKVLNLRVTVSATVILVSRRGRSRWRLLITVRTSAEDAKDRGGWLDGWTGPCSLRSLIQRSKGIIRTGLERNDLILRGSLLVALCQVTSTYAFKSLRGNSEEVESYLGRKGLKNEKKKEANRKREGKW